MQEAVILIPGIMGSVLEDDAGVVWPGSLGDVLGGYGKFDRLVKPDLKVTDVIRDVFRIVNQYDDLISSLKKCGFKETADGKGTLRVCPYDWRKDNAIAARGLAEIVDLTTTDLGADCEINLVAHSMGGLVARSYLESGLYNNKPGHARVRRLITLATPHRGAPLALSAAVGLEKRAFLSAAQVKAMANNESFPSLYQLLPPAGEPFARSRADEARFQPIDVYTSSVARALKLSESNLASASRFHKTLAIERKPAECRYFCFSGTRQLTTTSVEISGLGGNARSTRIDREGGGDGTVPVWSSSIAGVQMEPTGGEHGDIYKNGELKRGLGSLLGKPGLLLATGLVPELSVLPKIARLDAPVRVTIDLPADTVAIQGVLILQRMIDKAGDLIENPAALSRRTVAYSGPAIDHLVVIITAPDVPGIYRLEFVEDSLGTATTELIAQADN